jgi:small-conductance mechanosensitive channel
LLVLLGVAAHVEPRGARAQDAGALPRSAVTQDAGAARVTRAEDAGGAPRITNAQDGGAVARATETRSASPVSKPKPSASVSGAIPPPSASVSAAPAPSASAGDEPALAPSAEPTPSAAPLPSAEPVASAPFAVPSTAPPPAPSASVEKKAIAPGVAVRFADQPIFAIRVPREGRTAEERATLATKMLARAAPGAKGSDVKVQRKGDVAIVLVGTTPVVQLVPEDAVAAGDASLDVHAASVTASIREAVESERKRAAIAQSVLSISLLVFLGLVAFYLLQKIGEFAQRARVWVEEHGEHVLAVRVRRIEVVSPGTVKGTALVGLSVGKWIAQLAVVYLWVVYALSQFEATRGYTQRLTGLVLTPLSDLLARIAIGLPMLVVLVIAGFAVFVLVRFVGLFFSSVGRRENVVTWIPHDLVPPVSTLVRFGIIVSALLFIVPLITGSSEGVLARAGWVVVVALGLAATPVLANGLMGTLVLFGRRLRIGQYVEIGDYRGRIAVIGLLELCLEDEDQVEIRVPHFYTLFRPTRIFHSRSTVVGHSVSVRPPAVSVVPPVSVGPPRNP